MMKKTIIIMSVIILGFLGYFILGDYSGNDEAKKEFEPQSLKDNKTNEVAEEEEKHKAGENRDNLTGFASEEKLQEFKDEGLNPFGDGLKKDDLTDDDIRLYMHAMSHQKVDAEEKWGFYEMKDERIEWLLEGLEKADNLSDKKVYKDILVKWNGGDFSTADEDHNAIWALDGEGEGVESDQTVGKATGVLNEEQEEEYLYIRK